MSWMMIWRTIFSTAVADGARRFGALAPAAVLVTAALGASFGFTQVSARLLTLPSTELTNDARSDLPERVELAQVFTAALNAHDVDSLVELFTEEDAGATVNADRFAWGKFEIRLWAQQQVRAGIRTEMHDVWLTEHGAAWNADVYRDDWLALGLKVLPVTNTIWVHNGHLANFTSQPTEPGDLLRLGRTWRPGAAPDRPGTP